MKVELKDGAQRSEAYLRLNPVGRIPTIVDSDGPGGRPLVLTQSNAISLYIADKSGKLLPNQGEQRARTLEWLFLVVTDVIALSHHGFFIRQAFGNAASHHVIQWLDERALSMYVHIDRNLAEHTFLAGDAFSLADIAAYTITAALSGRLPWSFDVRDRGPIDLGVGSRSPTRKFTSHTNSKRRAYARLLFVSGRAVM